MECGTGVVVIRRLCAKHNRSKKTDGEFMVRALLDTATGRALSRYEEAVRTIHGRMDDQRVREAAIVEVRTALCDVGQVQLVEEIWGAVQERMDSKHPRNIRIADAEKSLEHLAGAQLTLTSATRKRGRIADEDEESMYVVAESMTHDHSNSVFVNKLRNVAMRVGLALVTRGWSRAVLHLNKTGAVLLEMDSSDAGLAPQDSRVLFMDLETGDQYTSKRFGGGFTSVRNNETHDTLCCTVLDHEHPSVCTMCLVQPAVLSHGTGNMYASTVKAVEQLLTHSQPFRLSCDPAVQKAELYFARSVSEFLGSTEITRLVPVDGEIQRSKDYDAILDFSYTAGWSIGGTATENTDAAEAARQFVTNMT